jgi:dihydrofolate reductase
MKISAIVAMGENRAIGFRGKIPWHLSADFKRFKELTMGHPIVMGRKTFESIGKPLPGRTNIVVTTDSGYGAEGCIVAHSLEEAFVAGNGADEVFVIGGAQIYQLALPQVQTLYLTKVHGTFEGDAFFPTFDESEWHLFSSENHAKDEKNDADFTWLVYERKKRVSESMDPGLRPCTAA